MLIKNSSGQISLNGVGLGQVSGEPEIVNLSVVLLMRSWKVRMRISSNKWNPMALGCFETEVSWFNSCFDRRH